MIVYSVAIFLSAFLLFLVQPMIGKYILPWFGGGPAVWTTCMLFFQTLLLVGYALAHAMTQWFRPRAQAAIYVILILAAAATLPIVPAEHWKPSDSSNPIGRIMLLLGVCLGAPYLVLASTSPMLQAWFSRTNPDRSPYRLYALSNLGSFAALLAYPLVVEPLLTRQAQSSAWAVGFLLYGLLGLTLSITLWLFSRNSAGKNPVNAASTTEQDDPRPTPLGDRLLWLLLPACGSVLLLAVTNALTQDVAVIPFLWVLPLAVYLLSYVLAFAGARWYPRALFVLLCPAALGAVYWLVSQGTDATVFVQIAAYCAALFVCCMICHGELYLRRPAARHVTSYYLTIAAGGAVGGLFVAVIAPLIFVSALELVYGFAACALLLAAALWRREQTSWITRQPMLTMALIAIAIVFGGLAAPWRPGAAGLSRYVTTLAMQRNFYGILGVYEHDGGREFGRHRELVHGRINHGAQFLDPDKKRWGTGYYSPDGGGGLAVRLAGAHADRRVGIIGLGIGTLATYGQAHEVFRFYEINPEVERLAREYFTYLADSLATIEVMLGDARLSMEREQPQEYDVLVMDAFTGDAIPVHLLTLEAFEVYRRHVRPGGVIAVHVSNQYVDLQPVLRSVAATMGWRCARVVNAVDEKKGIGRAQWILLSSDEWFFAQPEVASRATPIDEPALARPWTDDWTSLLPLLRREKPSL